MPLSRFSIQPRRAGGHIEADCLGMRGRGVRLERRHQAEKCFQSEAYAFLVLAELAAST